MTVDEFISAAEKIMGSYQGSDECKSIALEALKVGIQSGNLTGKGEAPIRRTYTYPSED